jgi:3-oxoadipate enol-lactonase
MHYTSRDGVHLHWTIDGRDAAPAIVLLNSIGTDLSLWGDVMPHLAGLRVVRMDTRGHGGSDAPDGDYALPMLAADVAAVMDAAGLADAILAGVSLGGMIAMQMALDHPARVNALLPICTSATMDPVAWDTRVRKVRDEGMASIVDLAMSRFLSLNFVAGNPATTQRVEKGLLEMDPAGYAGCAAAIRDMDIRGRLQGLDLPVVVVTGSLDTSTPFAGHGEHLVAEIPGAHHIELACAHLAPFEAPADLARTIIDFATIRHATAEASAV